MDAGPSVKGRPAATLAAFDHARLDVSADLTSNHLLQVPALLAPLCPSLAALHLARARLLLQLPPGSAIGWCHVCGGLREGMGGADRKASAVLEKAKDGEDGSPAKRRRKDQRPAATSGSRRRPARCTICGTAFRRPKPDVATLAAFPSARRAAKTRAATAAAAATATVPLSPPPIAAKKTDASGAASGQMHTQAPSPPQFSTTVASILSAVSAPQTIENRQDLLTAPITAPTGVAGPSAVKIEQSPKPKPLLARPTLSHIPSSDPNPPTWPRPEPPLSTKATLAASSSSSSSGAGGGSGTGRKKKKMSGLAKLLAERKEREEGEKQSAGRWGLG